MNILILSNILVSITVCFAAQECQSPEDCEGLTPTKCCVFKNPNGKGKCENLSRRGKRCNNPYSVRPLYQGKYHRYCPCEDGLECVEKKKRERERSRGRRGRRSPRTRPGREPVRQCEMSDGTSPEGSRPDNPQDQPDTTTESVTTNIITTEMPPTPSITDGDMSEEEDKVITDYVRDAEQTTTTTENSYVTDGEEEQQQQPSSEILPTPTATYTSSPTMVPATDNNESGTSTISYDGADEAIPEQGEEEQRDVDEPSYDLGTEMNNEDEDGTEPGEDSIDERDPSMVKEPPSIELKVDVPGGSGW